VEVISSEHPDGRPVERSVRGGVYAVFRPDPGVAESLRSYGAIIGMVVGPRSRQALVYRPQHFVGHEVPFGIARMMIERRPIAGPIGHYSDVVAAAKQRLEPGTVLDGEGGFHAYGLVERAVVAKAERLVPAGLLRGAEVVRSIPEDALITYDDVRLSDTFAARLRAKQDLDADL
jgi:predicted homoserine dehydrogenase-like protein